VRAVGRDSSKTGRLVKTNSLRLAIASLKPKGPEAEHSRLSLQLRKQKAGDTAAPDWRHYVHALDLSDLSVEWS
jgi:hypothetical protein